MKRAVQRTNRVKQALQAGGRSVGAIMQMASPEMIEIAGNTGYDFVIIDCEHGSFHLEQAVQLLRAADAVGITPLVRLPNDDPSFIMRVLDAGAMGIVVPNVSSKVQMEAVVAAARYKSGSNGGRRGACPGSRATWHQTTDWPGFVEWSNHNILVWALIENVEGVRNAAEIASVPGLDAIMPGPFDLAHDMGLPGQPGHERVVAAVSEVIAHARTRGVDVVTNFFSTTPETMAQEQHKWSELGVRIFSIGTDRRMMYHAMARAQRAVTGCQEAPGKSG